MSTIYNISCPRYNPKLLCLLIIMKNITQFGARKCVTLDNLSPGCSKDYNMHPLLIITYHKY